MGSQGYTLLRGQLALPGGSESGQEGRHGLEGREKSHSIVLPSSAAAGTWGWGSQLLPTRGAGAGARPHLLEPGDYVSLSGLMSSDYGREWMGTKTWGYQE